MRKCIRTNSEDPDFRKLVEELDAELRIRDGDEHSFYAQYNKIDMIKHVIMAYEDSTPVGCGAIKEYSNDTMEVKRMYVLLSKRGQGIATMILKELEAWALELNFTKCILETGEKQHEAVRLYEKNDYKRIPNFGQYENVENSICFEKKLSDSC
jgi:GNAT superfamily N-acetyltransferase